MAVTPEVLIVGAGPAGLSAAIKLARAGVRVLVLEGADYAGAENWSGCVYHGDAWSRPDLLGSEWSQAPRERRIVARSLFLHDGLRAAGFEARAVPGNDYGDAWTVLRPKVDRWLASRAIDCGVTVLPATTVTGLRYGAQGRVVGVNTERGPVEADVVFLAEGDAAGLVAREGLERASAPHYAQGIKAVFALDPREIERRFGVGENEGVAQEWVLRNGTAAGREVGLNATAFLYTNRASLSLGLVLPLDRLAQNGRAEHAQLLQRVITAHGIAPYLLGARQVAYGAKVIRAGGIAETPEWIADGLAVGGGALGLGMEFPYPNFIGPAITSGIAFAEAVLRLREQGDGYSRQGLQREYAQRLRASDDAKNAELLKAWPAALHRGDLLFGHAPALLGQLIDAQDLPPRERRAQRERALAVALRQLRADLAQTAPMREVLHDANARAGDVAVPPLAVRFVATDRDGTTAILPGDSPLLALAAQTLGHVYGRRLPTMHARLVQVRRVLGGLNLALARNALALLAQAARGGVRLAGDLLAYRLQRVPLRALLLRPYHAHEEATRAALAWEPAQRASLSSLSWLAMDRHHPDRRHISLPLALPAEGAQALRRVCPAEVYQPTSHWGGAASQYENCIKCESCRVSVPGIDWHRSSSHRLRYRLPDDLRYGADGSVRGPIETKPINAPTLGAIEQQQWRALLRALQSRGAMVDDATRHQIRALWRGVPTGPATRAIHARVGGWIERRAYGWAQNEIEAMLPSLPASAFVMSREAAVREAIVQATVQLMSFFTLARLREAAQRPWTEEERDSIRAWIDATRGDAPYALEQLAGFAPALAWVAAHHLLAELSAGRHLASLSAVVGRAIDGLSEWVPGIAQVYVDADGQPLALDSEYAHGTGLDAAHPVRYAVPENLLPLPITGELATFALAIACGIWNALRERAVAYARERVQFRHSLQDRAGRDGIAKFGTIKAMLANIDQAGASLRHARSVSVQEPNAVLALIHHCMGVRMDGVPWLAGQIFGGMAYSEDDVLAPRYRDAMLLAQWPSLRSEPIDARAFQVRLHRAALAEADADPIRERAYLRVAEGPVADLYASPVAQRPLPAPSAAHRARALAWDAHARLHYRSGSFLHGRLLAPRELLIPEHFRRDPQLRSTRASVLRLLRSGFRSPTRGEPYGRYIDARHGIPTDDIERLRAFNAFATVVPEQLGGKGWTKAQYAVMNMLTMGDGDTSLGLLIMASTSIGTMPVILGLDKDLPRVEAELRACLDDDVAWRALADGIVHLREMLVRPQPQAFKRAMTAWATQAQRLFMAPGSSLKYLARDFLLALQRATELAKERQLAALDAQLAGCERALIATKEVFIEELADLPARRAAHQRFLRWLGTGQISAFALTEPVAGSDTGGIQTRAVLRRVAAVPGEHGCFRFVPHGRNEERVLLDAERLEFDGRSVVYRLPDGTAAQLDDSEWDLARNQGRRLLRVGAHAKVYHDIGVVTASDGGWVYRYWEVTGNKMWITNGAIADRYSLYAQTEFGESAFMLERRSEGLRIGPNEHKLGQRASPTNELTFDRVRIGADQMIGYRGHGQVNALETLSVGRGGLVMGCATLVARALREYRELWRAHPTHHRMALFELERLQTLAARLVGLMDRADLTAGDFRIEAALSKYLASEGAHRVLLWLEQIMGPMAAANERLVEKWRRDARVLNIYEGTNEIQRFLVLKDLPSLLAQSATEAEVHDRDLHKALHAFRDFVAPRLAALGARVWQEPDLQAQWFPVVEWAGELYSWCALHERERALAQTGEDGPTVAHLRALCEQLALHVDALAARIRREFEGEERETGSALAAASLAIAERALADALPADAGPCAVEALDGDWIVVLRSHGEWRDGQLVWAGWDESDRGTLDRLLAWRDAFPAMRVGVAALAPEGVEDHLRRLQAAGAEVVHVVQEAGARDLTMLADYARAQGSSYRRWVIGGAEVDAECEAFAAAIGLTVVPRVQRLGGNRRGVWFAHAGSHRHYVSAARGVLLAFAVTPTGRSDRFGVAAWLDALRAPLPLRYVAASGARFRPAPPPVTDAVPSGFDDPQALAAWLLARYAGSAAPASAARVIEGEAPLTAQTLLLTPLARLDGLSQSRVLDAARDLADAFAILAWHPEANVSVRISRPIAGLQGVWRLPVIDGDTPSLSALVTRVHEAKRVLVGADQAPLAATLGARLGWPVVTRVIGLTDTEVTMTGEGWVREQALPERAVVVIDPNYRAGSEPHAPSGSVAVHALPRCPAARASALGRWIAAAGSDDDWTRADVIVDIGIGIADQDEYARWVMPLQHALSAALRLRVEVGGTRKMVQDLKLLPAERQIGQTGSRVAPRLLFALGVSGAPQHMQGIDKGTLMIALNRDPDAPIFAWQREYGAPAIIRCVGALDEWLPALTATLSASVPAPPPSRIAAALPGG